MNTIPSKHFKLTATMILIIGAVWIGVSASFPGGTHQGDISAPQNGFLAPDFSLVSLDGETITLSDLRGHPILINLWASWCGPCRLEMPAMERIYLEYKDKGFIILAINTTSQDSLPDVRVFIQEHKLTFPILLDQEQVSAELYQLQALPSSFFIDQEGIIQEVIIGGPMAEALLRTRVEKLLEEVP
jgi:peroxiredoxin